MHRRLVKAWGLSALLIAGLACQDYPFEYRPPLHVSARKIDEVVQVVVPVDILFVIDNSASMSEEISNLKANLGLFAEELSKFDVDYQVGIITVDTAEAVPGHSYTQGVDDNNDGVVDRYETRTCLDSDTNSDGIVDSTTCDGGRLRTSALGHRILARPAPADRAQWVAELSGTLPDALGSPVAFEAGLEAARIAVTCGSETGCTDTAITLLDKGFIRTGADLVIIFMTDEDDCSYVNNAYLDNPNVYEPPALGSEDKALCSPDECYAYYLPGLSTFRSCVSGDRTVAPPPLSPVSDFLDALVAVKGEVTRIRAAAILGSVPDVDASLGYAARACFQGPADDCGCWSTTLASNATYCAVPAELGQYTQTQATAANRYCQALPGGRYVELLDELKQRRLAVGARPDVLVDSICDSNYESTLYNIVNNVILSSCFNLSVTPPDPSSIQVSLNGETLANVAPHSGDPGWSWTPGTQQICLEGGLSKQIGDRFEIFVLDSGT